MRDAGAVPDLAQGHRVHAAGVQQVRGHLDQQVTGPRWHALTLEPRDLGTPRSAAGWPGAARRGGALVRLPRAPSALCHRDAACSLLTVGVPTGQEVLAHAERVRTALSPWTTGGALPSFSAGTGPRRLARSYDPATLARLGELARRYDPVGVLRAGQVPPR